MLRRLACATAAAVLLGACPVSALAGPPSGLSSNGRALWNFEALLHDTFGNRFVCTRGPSLNFLAPANQCTPLAVWLPYTYEFSSARHSAYHLISRLPNRDFGNRAEPVRINGRHVSCGRGNHSYLMTFANAATFTVACVEPL